MKHLKQKKLNNNLFNNSMLKQIFNNKNVMIYISNMLKVNKF